MGIGPQVSLIVAAMDLKLVQLLRHAMRAAGLTAAHPRTHITPAPHLQPRLRIHPTPHIEPRPHIHPAPLFEPRLTYHPTTVAPPVSTAPSAPAQPEQPRITKSPIQPPWKLLPWQNNPTPPPEIKLVVQQPDLHIKGTVFDVFV